MECPSTVDRNAPEIYNGGDKRYDSVIEGEGWGADVTLSTRVPEGLQDGRDLSTSL